MWVDGDGDGEGEGTGHFSYAFPRAVAAPLPLLSLRASLLRAVMSHGLPRCLFVLTVLGVCVRVGVGVCVSSYFDVVMSLCVVGCVCLSVCERVRACVCMCQCVYAAALHCAPRTMSPPSCVAESFFLL